MIPCAFFAILSCDSPIHWTTENAPANYRKIIFRYRQRMKKLFRLPISRNVACSFLIALIVGSYRRHNVTNISNLLIELLSRFFFVHSFHCWTNEKIKRISALNLVSGDIGWKNIKQKRSNIMFFNSFFLFCPIVFCSLHFISFFSFFLAYFFYEFFPTRFHCFSFAPHHFTVTTSYLVVCV